MKRAWLDARTLPPGSQQRLKIALSCREGVTPDSVIADWGDYDEDYPDSYVEKDHDHGVDNYYGLRQPIKVRFL